MNNKLLFVPLMGLSLLCACDKPEKKPVMTTEGYQNADNTGVNVRDRDGNLPTPQDQAENESDREIIKRIRQALVKDSSLSTNAQNVKIMSINGKVTLRGPVNSAQEKAKVVDKVKGVVGITGVDNQLEVAANS